jgi:polysaccharide biosynthesis transport protein
MTTAESEPERELRLSELLATLKRRRRAVSVALIACVVPTVLLALLLPSYYQSSGVILIEQQEVPPELVRSMISAYADQRVQTINQRVMTTQNLLDIMRRYDLYADQRRYESREELVERMRKDIVFKMISADVVDPRSGLPRQATIAFSISFESRSPDKSAKVANELVTLYLNENLTERTRLAKEAASFLGEEGTRLEQQVAELQSKLADFKSKHIQALPELATTKLQFLDRAQTEVNDAQLREMSLQQQRGYLEAQLAQIKPNSQIVGEDGQRILSPADRLRTAKSQLASDAAVYSPDHPDVLRLKREIAGLEAAQGAQPATNDLLRQLDDVQGQLAQARQKYTPDHPDVKHLEGQVASLQAALAAQPESKGPATSEAALGGPPDNPAYIQLRAQLSTVLSDLDEVHAQTNELRARIAGYQRDIDAGPELEKEYHQLSTDYDTARIKYQEVRAKEIEAQVGESLEADRKGERFTLIDPPLLPEEPVSPNRWLILILGLVLSAAISGGVAALRESTDATVRGGRDVVDLLQTSPLAFVPHITTQAELRAARRRRRIGWLATASTCVVAALLVHFFYRPLDVLWYMTLRHLGI